MAAACQTIADTGVIRSVLATVDCQTRTYAEVGYSALTAGNGLFQTALTILLTIYVAWMGIRVMFGQGRLSDAWWIGLKIGVVLLLATSWPVFQTLVFDVAHRAPLEVAATVAAPMQSDRGGLAANPVDGLQVAYDELTETAIAFGKQAGPTARAYSSAEAAAANTVSTATGALFVMSAGVISAATIAVGIMTAIGPVFIALILFPATQGLFVGWVRTMVAVALTPMVGWLLLVLMLTVLEPWLGRLAEQRAAQALDPQTGISAASLIFVFGFAQAALILGASAVAFGFSLPRSARDRAAAPAALAAAAQGPAPILQPTRAERLAFDLQRDTAQAEARARSMQLAAQVAPSTRTPSAAPPPSAGARLGDAYRRQPYTARRAGAAR